MSILEYPLQWKTKKSESLPRNSFQCGNKNFHSFIHYLSFKNMISKSQTCYFVNLYKKLSHQKSAESQRLPKEYGQLFVQACGSKSMRKSTKQGSKSSSLIVSKSDLAHRGVRWRCVSEVGLEPILPDSKVVPLSALQQKLQCWRRWWHPSLFLSKFNLQ